jgi:hypothetical protein
VSAWSMWDRNTLEGYGSCDVHHGGVALLDVDCWKPTGTLRSRRDEFFVGGSRDIADVEYRYLFPNMIHSSISFLFF